MLSNDEKILILQKKVVELDQLKDSILNYIDKIQGGMEDPDMTIEECNNILPSIEAKKQAVVAKKQELLEAI